MTADTFLFNAGSLFFAAWIAVIGALTVSAFGRDLLPGNAPDAESALPQKDSRAL